MFGYKLVKERRLNELEVGLGRSKSLEWWIKEVLEESVPTTSQLLAKVFELAWAKKKLVGNHYLISSGAKEIEAWIPILVKDLP